MGSVSPLIATAQYLIKEKKITNADFIWIGSYGGPERKVITELHWSYQPLHSGKWRRYFSWQNFTDLIKVLIGFFQSLIIIIREHPTVMVTAGSFLAIPFYLAAKLTGVKVIIHQLDLPVGLANRIMAHGACAITVSWPELVSAFSRAIEYIGTPIRDSILRVKSSPLQQQLVTEINNRPVILITGGGTGADQLNNFIDQIIDQLTNQYFVIHLTGVNKIGSRINKKGCYYVNEFFDEEQMGFVLQRADLIVSRAGIGALSEMLALGKKVLIIPIADSHQEKNAQYFRERQLVDVIYSSELTKELFLSTVSSSLLQHDLVQQQGRELVRPDTAAAKLGNKIIKYG